MAQIGKQLYLGVDGGGTHTRAIAVDEFGAVHGYGQAASTNRNHHTRDEVRENMRTVMVNALGAGDRLCDLQGVFLGMCGVSTDADRDDIISIVREIQGIAPELPVAVQNDTWIGLVGGLSGRPGIVLIAGTGSACFGIAQDGQTALCGGWGALADDAGSAPWIGQRAINVAVKCEDGRSEPTSLREAVFTFLGLEQPRQLIDRVHNQDFSREQMGMIAPLVTAAHDAGDATATAILHDAAAELAAMVRAVALPLFGEQATELILVGGLALSGTPFQPMLTNAIHRLVPTVRVVPPEMSPVHGAALEALRHGGHEWTAEMIAQLQTHHASTRSR